MKKIYFVLLMNVFAKIAKDINKGVNNMEDNINKGIDTAKRNVSTTINHHIIKQMTNPHSLNVKTSVTDKNSVEYTITQLRMGNVTKGIDPQDVIAMNDGELKKYLIQKFPNLNVKVMDDLEGKEDVVSKMSPADIYETIQENTIQEDTIQEDKTQELLEDPQIANIFSDLRKDFPSPTGTPGPINIPTPTGTPGPINIEGFEDVPLTVNEQVNRHLKKKFINNFIF